MNNPSFDYSHVSFLDGAVGDVDSSEILFSSRNFSQSAYSLQQSIEKGCKFVGMTLGVFDYKKLRDIGHFPHKVFKALFESEIMISMYGTSDIFSRFDRIIRGTLTFNERVHCILIHLEDASNSCAIPVSKDISYYSALKCHMSKDEFKSTSMSEHMQTIDSCKHLPNFEKLVKGLIDDINLGSRCINLLLILSFLVWDIESNSRYPDYDKNTTPGEIYKDGTPFVDNLPYFILKQKECLNTLRELFTKH